MLEAEQRQVIVFTHDTAFLGELLDEVKRAAGRINHVVRHLECMGGSPGHVSDELPWEHQRYDHRIDKHEKTQRALAQTWSPYPSAADRDEMRHEYSRLRATLERVIQDVVFNGVVQRYRNYIEVSKLSGVVGLEQGEFKEICRLYKCCNDVVDAHDPSSNKNASVPTPIQLAVDIQALKAVVGTIRARRPAASTGGNSKP